MKNFTHRSILALVLTYSCVLSQAQVLFVNDNDYVTYNTDTILTDMAGAGIEFDTYDIPTEGVPPGFADMEGHPLVIWYCSGDGAGLGLWDVQADLLNYVSSGGKVWFIGTDMIYDEYGGAPVAFQSGDLPLDLMGIPSCDVQSYGDDGNLGCPEMDVDAGVAGQFQPTLHWSFDTFWWADGCTLGPDAQAIYAMGPDSYVLNGAISMVANSVLGTEVMSTFFDPALIDTYANRVLFLQQTLQYLGVQTDIASAGQAGPALTVAPDGTDNILLDSNEALRSVAIRGMSGQLEYSSQTGNTKHMSLQTTDLSAGLFLITVTTISGARTTAKWVVH